MVRTYWLAIVGAAGLALGVLLGALVVYVAMVISYEHHVRDQTERPECRAPVVPHSCMG